MMVAGRPEHKRTQKDDRDAREKVILHPWSVVWTVVYTIKQSIELRELEGGVGAGGCENNNSHESRCCPVMAT